MVQISCIFVPTRTLKAASMSNILLGKLYSFAFPERSDAIQGIVLDHNQEWTLLRRVFDYSVDGFTLFRNKEVVVRRAEYEKFAERILSLKYHSLQKTSKIPKGSLHEILTYLERKYRLIQLDMPDGKAFDVVRYLCYDSNQYVFDELTARGNGGIN